MYKSLALLVVTLSLAGCDLVEVVPPDVPPPDGVTHPYGAGNGKVVFLSDLAAAERIDVTLAGERIGSVLRFTGCPGRVTTDDSLATAVRTAGRYQYSALSTTGLSWASTAVTITEDEETRVVLIGRPSQYALHYPAEIEGLPAASTSQDYFQHTVGDSGSYRLVVQRPSVVQGDRIDVVVNNVVVARGLALGATDVQLSVPLVPGANYIAARLSRDEGGNGTSSRLLLYAGDTYGGSVDNPVLSRWKGINVRYSC